MAISKQLRDRLIKQNKQELLYHLEKLNKRVERETDYEKLKVIAEIEREYQEELHRINTYPVQFEGMVDLKELVSEMKRQVK